MRFVSVLSILAVLSSFAIAEENDFDVRLVPMTGDAAGEWPRWRGPRGDGVAVRPVVDHWSADENVLWSSELPGHGNSQPIVWGDRVLVTTAYEKGKRRSIVCLSAVDGERLWEAFAPDAEPEKASGKNGHASSTPCTDGRNVYAYFGNHGLLCVSLEKGERVWHRPIDPIRTRHGTACSPLLHDGRVIVFQDQNDGKSFIAAFDGRTGEPVWSTPRPHESIGWGSPVAVRFGEREEIVVNGQFHVYGYDPRTGEELWKVKGSTDEVTPTPVAGEGLVFCSSGRAGPTLAIRPGGRGNVTESHVAWRTRKGSPFVPSTVLVNGLLFLVNDVNSVASCLDARTGETKWQQRLDGRGFSASLVATTDADGDDARVYYTSEEGRTFVVRAAAEFELLHVNDLGEKTLATPAIAGGRWYLRTESRLVCVGTKAETSEPASDDDGFVSLFDGKSLEGWAAIPKGTDDDWSVRDGAIVGIGSANRNAYLVWRDADLADFELRLQYRLPGKGNTGIEIHAVPDATGKRPYEGYHADLGHVGIGPHILGAWDFHFAKRREPPCPRGTRLDIAADGSLTSTAIEDALTKEDVRPEGEWNDVRIVADGRDYSFFVNGKLASAFTDRTREHLARGVIGLQLHDKGMRVEFRNIRMRTSQGESMR